MDGANVNSNRYNVALWPMCVQRGVYWGLHPACLGELSVQDVIDGFSYFFP